MAQIRESRHQREVEHLRKAEVKKTRNNSSRVLVLVLVMGMEN
jgi:hypothetical protein